MVWLWLVVAWLAVCAAWDWRTRTVPNGWTMPPLAALLGLRVWCGHWQVVGVVLLVGYLVLWARDAMGGADVKIGLALTLFSPWHGYLSLVGAVGLAVVWKKRTLEDHTPAVVGMFAAVFLLTTLIALHIIKASALGVVCL